jgi:hypothetical protein
MNDEIAPNLAGERLTTGHMPVPATNAQQEPVRAGVTSTSTTCSVLSVPGARHATASFTGGALWRETPNAPSRSTAALLERFLRRRNCPQEPGREAFDSVRTTALHQCVARPHRAR